MSVPHRFTLALTGRVTVSAMEAGNIHGRPEFATVDTSLPAGGRAARSHQRG